MKSLHSLEAHGQTDSSPVSPTGTILYSASQINTDRQTDSGVGGHSDPELITSLTGAQLPSSHWKHPERLQQSVTSQLQSTEHRLATETDLENGVGCVAQGQGPL